ncbi:FAD-binding protein [soil metagenome]
MTPDAMTDIDSPATTTTVANVLVIGTGAAGARAAIAAADSGREVLMVGKRPPRDAHTVLAAGGINAALGTVDPEDSWQQHFADTVTEAYMLSEPRTVEILTREAPDAVHELADWGCEFARTEDGQLDQRYFGAHRYRRTCYAGDYTGRAILYTLHDQVAERGIEIHEGRYVTRLLVADGTCFGAYAFDISSGTRTVYLADAVVLAAGGHTRLWRRSSSRRDENTGDAMGLALQAGCALADMELVQFHPTGMVWPEEMAGTLVTEAVRGEGGRLFNAEGERFMERYDSERMELSTRDRVALANYTEITEGRGTEHGGVLLDISHVDRDTIVEKLPRMYRQFLETQMLDISSDPVEVAPTAHYSMGGVVVDPETHATDVTGLYAAGECTAGVHGANRLGGNSLAETVVFGRRAGAAAASYSNDLEVVRRDKDAIAAAAQDLSDLVREGSEFARPLQRAIRDTMTDNCGVVRDHQRLTEGLQVLDDIETRLHDVDVRPTSEGWGDLALALDLRGSLLSARATIMGALERTETRGCHVRDDHPDIDPDQLVNHVVRLAADGSLQFEQRPVPPIPEALRDLVVGASDYEVEGRLLE